MPFSFCAGNKKPARWRVCFGRNLLVAALVYARDQTQEDLAMSVTVNQFYTLPSGKVISEQDMVDALTLIRDDRVEGMRLDPELLELLIDLKLAHMRVTRMMAGNVRVRYLGTSGLTPWGEEFIDPEKAQKE
ncbi:MAG: hypothetical protein COA41_11370 [Sphingopyxis sp.]|nr:MAG: hypothetical protein COA41_11370 [Sphingopyxis sp.]